jgi:RimJ/RimL family protein N-acetyltransferase
MHALTTERLILRQLTLDDAEFIHALTNDPDWIRYIGDRGIHTNDDARAYITKGPVASYAEFGYGLYAVERKGDPAPVGICGLISRPWLDAADIGFAFLPGFRGLGYAHEAATATVDQAKALGMTRLVAIVSEDNAASVRLVGKLGMSFERKIAYPGTDEEVCIYGMQLL